MYGNYKKSDNCDIEFNKISQSFGTQQELDEIAANTDHSVPLMSQKTAPGMEFDLKKDTTEHQPNSPGVGGSTGGLRGSTAPTRFCPTSYHTLGIVA